MVTEKLKYERLGLTTSEYEAINRTLNREPTDVELAIYSLMWSEHCGYKHSRSILKLLPSKAEYVLQGPGENAGVIDIGDGLAIAMKIESHNHPSAVEPFQGAATGVGGIVRDIFAMGARPIASLNSLRFGDLSRPRQKYLFEGVVGGIGAYGNCLGVPTVAGEVYFDDSYAGNCLVNAMTIGLATKARLINAKAAGEGNLLVLMGASTGRDGIGGASVLASQEFDQTLQEKRPSVQVGDPFMEKLLIESCLELLDEDLLVALGDLGAAGITSSVSEMAARGNVGVDIDVAKVPLRETEMKAWEIMISESQERMLAVVTPEKLPAVQDVCKKWGLESAVIGKITPGNLMRVFKKNKLLASMPVKSLTDEAPVYQPPAEKPDYLKTTSAFDFNGLDYEADPNDILAKLLASPNICSRRWIWKQYDHQVQTNTVVLPGADSAVLRLRGSRKGLALTVDGNGRYSYLDPYVGAQIAVAEAARNLACVGAKPMAVTDCLNFGNPEKPAIYWQFQEAVKGIAAACGFFKLPVISGNVSFYNESFGVAIYPTPTIGMIGILEDVNNHCTHSFKKAGSIIVLIGENKNELGGSEYLKVIHGLVEGLPPEIDLAEAERNQELCRLAIQSRLLLSAHDCSEGGLAVALAECCMEPGLGAIVEVGAANRTSIEMTASLFGESQGRFIISMEPDKLSEFKDLAAEIGANYNIIGKVIGDRIKIDDKIDVSVLEMKNYWDNALDELVK